MTVSAPAAREPQTVTIRPPRGKVHLGDELAELWRFRHLVRTLVERDLRIRYKNSVLGVAWTMVNPLIQVFVLTVAIGFILGAGPSNLSAYIFCATLPWTFFQSAVLDSSTTVLVKLPLLKKVYFPREIPIIASVCQNFVQLGISLLVFVLYRWVVSPLFVPWPGGPPREILWLPVVVAQLFLLTLGISFFVGAANVFYEDVKFIVSAGMTFLFYLVPIIYFAENIFYSPRIPARWHWLAYHLYLLNPLAWIVTAFRQVFFAPAVISSRGAAHPVASAPFDGRYFAITGLLSVVVCLAGYSYFNSHKWRFTERP